MNEFELLGRKTHELVDLKEHYDDLSQGHAILREHADQLFNRISEKDKALSNLEAALAMAESELRVANATIANMTATFDDADRVAAELKRSTATIEKLEDIIAACREKANDAVRRYTYGQQLVEQRNLEARENFNDMVKARKTIERQSKTIGRRGQTIKELRKRIKELEAHQAS